MSEGGVPIQRAGCSPGRIRRGRVKPIASSWRRGPRPGCSLRKQGSLKRSACTLKQGNLEYCSHAVSWAGRKRPLTPEGFWADKPGWGCSEHGLEYTRVYVGATIICPAVSIRVDLTVGARTWILLHHRVSCCSARAAPHAFRFSPQSGVRHDIPATRGHDR